MSKMSLEGNILLVRDLFVLRLFGLIGGVLTMILDSSCSLCNRKIRISSYWAAGKIIPTDYVCEEGSMTCG